MIDLYPLQIRWTSVHDAPLTEKCPKVCLGRSPFSHLSHPNPNPNSYPNLTLTLNLTPP